MRKQFYLLRFEITKMLIAVLKNKFIIIFYVIIFGTLSFLCVEVRSQNSQSGLRLGLGSLNARVVRRCATADELCRIKLKSGRRDL